MLSKSKVISSRNAWSFIACGIFVAYAALRFRRLTSNCLWFDEIFGVHAATFSWGEMLGFVALDLVHPPFFYALLKSWISMGGDGLYWLRLLPAIFAILTIFPFLHLCRELKLGPPSTCLAFLLLAVNGPLIKYSQEVRMYSVLLFLATCSLWLFARFYFHGKNIWLLGLVNLLLVYTHYSGWLVILCEVINILIAQRIKIRPILTMAAAVFFLSVPWVWAIWSAAAAGSDIGQNIGWIERPGVGETLEFLYDLFEPFYFRQSSADPAVMTLVPLFLLVLVAVSGVHYFIRRRAEFDRDTDLLLLIFSVAPVSVALLVSLLLPYSIWGTRHLIFVFVPITILAARFFTSIGAGGVRLVSISFLMVVLLLAFATFLVAPRPEYIWCSWNTLADELTVAAPPPKERARLYVFEDLVAYHFWYALRDSPRFRVTLIRGVNGLPNDPAYFLPRGFDEVSVASPDDEIDEQENFAAFRLPAKQVTAAGPDPTALNAVQPIALFVSRGFEPRIIDAIQVGNETAYLVEFEKRSSGQQGEARRASNLSGE